MTRAEIVYTGGRFLTLDPGRPMAEALAVSGGRLVAVGSDAEILALAGPGTRRRAMCGRFAMPGLIESHTHGLWGACRDLYEVYVGHGADAETLGRAVAERAATAPEGQWVTGGPWRLDMAPALGMTPRAWLDRLAPEHPVALADFSQHAIWANSRALALAGLDAPGLTIPGGVIERDADGAPTGMLAETAIGPLRRLMAFTPAQLSAAYDTLQSYFHRLGYTGFKEPMADEAGLACYADAFDKGRMRMHMAAHITVFSPLDASTVPLDQVDRMRVTYARPDLKTSFAKLFLDGVAPTHTASFLQPYLPHLGYDPATHDPDATLLLRPEVLNRLMTDLDARGYVVKTHAVGDNAIRKVLDAVAAARAANGNSGLRHEIAHTPFVDDADLPRFAQLGVVAEVSPKLWLPNAATPAQRAVLGDGRMTRLHRIRTYLDHGAEVIFGTDWPAAAPDADPWTGLAGMLTRQDVQGRYRGTLNADEAIPLDRALPLFTRNAARAMGREGEVGQLTTGAWADFIVLPEDLRAMSPAEIAVMAVQETVWKGETVHAV